MKRGLLAVVDHPHRSVAALDGRPEELLPLGATVVAGSADDSFQPNVLLWIVHMNMAKPLINLTRFDRPTKSIGGAPPRVASLRERRWSGPFDGPAASTEQESQHEPGDESADVRHVGDATTRPLGACEGTDAAQQLQSEPETDDDQRGHFRYP